MPWRLHCPQLLSPTQPESVWDESDNLFLRYEYEFMPKGILTRFIVEMHQWIEQQTCIWKTGVVLNKDDARAEVIELYRYHKGEIRIRISGNRKRDLLTTIRHELGKIHATYERLKYQTFVPCNCASCKGSQTPHFYPLQVLHKFLDDNQREIQCQISYQMVNVQGLVDDVAVARSPSPDPRRERSHAQYDRLQSEWDLRNAKLMKLRTAAAIETDTTRKFQLQQQIQSEAAELAQIEQTLDNL